MVDPEIKKPFWVDKNRKKIEQIASVLEIRAEQLFSCGERSTDSKFQVVEDAIELIKLFYLIDGDQARRRCIEYVRTVASEAVSLDPACDPGQPL